MGLKERLGPEGKLRPWGRGRIQQKHNKKADWGITESSAVLGGGSCRGQRAPAYLAMLTPETDFK